MNITRNIRCTACGFNGKIEAHDTVGSFPENQIFKNLGKDSSTGFMHFLCPACNTDLVVDPLKVFGADTIVGYDAYLPPSRRRAVPLVWGLLSVALAFFFILYFASWWGYLLSGLFLLIGVTSFKTFFFASDKEISELTSTGPTSEETKEAFKNRL
jgi:hypothetical protein